jgi:hypothetical protein
MSAGLGSEETPSMQEHAISGATESLVVPKSTKGASADLSALQVTIREAVEAHVLVTVASMRSTLWPQIQGEVQKILELHVATQPKPEGVDIDKQRDWCARIIDQAISENRSSGRLLTALCGSIAVIGMSLLVYGAAFKEISLAVVGGAIPSALMWPAINGARKTRHENIALRTLGLALGTASSSSEAMSLVTNFFGAAFVVSGRKTK